jgi:hypothetical protein
MSGNEALIDEICAELQQLCTDLEKIKAIPKGNYNGDIIKDRERQDVAYSPDGIKEPRSLQQSESKFAREEHGGRSCL